MPTFAFECACGAVFDDLVPITAEVAESSCPQCGGVVKASFSPTTNLRLAPWMRREVEDMNAKQAAYMDRPDIKAKLKRGEISIDTSDKYCSNMDGDAATSSIIDRARYEQSFIDDGKTVVDSGPIPPKELLFK